MTITSARTSAPRSNTGRIKLYGRALLLAVAAAWLITVVASSGADGVSGRLGGDFPAFYAAGELAGAGEWDSLYDPDTQAAAQAELFAEDGSFLYFAYPPFVAATYAPLAELDYRIAYALHTLAMVAAAIGALALLRPSIPVLQRHFETAVVAMVLFYPLFRAVTGGQNTGLTMLLLAWVWRSLDRHDDLWAGVAIALLAYKPQFAVPLLGLVVVRRRWSAVATAVVGAAALWCVGLATMGSGWLATWWAEVSDFAALDADINGHNAVSWLGFSEAVFGSGTTVARALAAPFVLATIAALVWMWRQLDTGSSERSPRIDSATVWAATIVGLIMISPHAMFYDAGLLVLTGVVLVDRALRHGADAAMTPLLWTIGAIWLLAWSQLAASTIGLAPLFALVLAAGAAVAVVLAPRGPTAPVNA